MESPINPIAALFVGAALLGISATAAVAQAAPPFTEPQLVAGRYTLAGAALDGRRRIPVRGRLTIKPGKAGTVGLALDLSAPSGRRAIREQGVPIRDDTIVVERTGDAARRGAAGAVDQKDSNRTTVTGERLTIDVRGDGLLKFELRPASGPRIEGWGIRALPGRVLVVITAADTLRLVDRGPDGLTDKGYPRPRVGGGAVGTGFDLSEVVRVVRALKAKGFAVEIATPGGKTPTVDVNALTERGAEATIAQGQSLFGRLVFSKLSAKTDAAVSRRVKLARRSSARRSFRPVIRALGSVTGSDRLTRYAGVFVANGRGNLVDLHQDPDMGKVLAHCYARVKPVGLNGHAPFVLLSSLGVPWTDPAADARAQRWRYRGYKVASAMGGHEVVIERFGAYRGAGKVPCHVDAVLERFGLTHKFGWTGFQSYVRVDRELITGVNPASADAVIAKFVQGVIAWKAKRSQSRLKEFRSLAR